MAAQAHRRTGAQPHSGIAALAYRHTGLHRAGARGHITARRMTARPMAAPAHHCATTQLHRRACGSPLRRVTDIQPSRRGPWRAHGVRQLGGLNVSGSAYKSNRRGCVTRPPPTPTTELCIVTATSWRSVSKRSYDVPNGTCVETLSANSHHLHDSNVTRSAGRASKCSALRTVSIEMSSARRRHAAGPALQSRGEVSLLPRSISPGRFWRRGAAQPQHIGNSPRTGAMASPPAPAGGPPPYSLHQPQWSTRHSASVSHTSRLSHTRSWSLPGITTTRLPCLLLTPGTHAKRGSQAPPAYALHGGPDPALSRKRLGLGRALTPGACQASRQKGQRSHSPLREQAPIAVRLGAKRPGPSHLRSARTAPTQQRVAQAPETSASALSPATRTAPQRPPKAVTPRGQRVRNRCRRSNVYLGPRITGARKRAPPSEITGARCRQRLRAKWPTSVAKVCGVRRHQERRGATQISLVRYDLWLSLGTTPRSSRRAPPASR